MEKDGLKKMKWRREQWKITRCDNGCGKIRDDMFFMSKKKII